MSANKPTRRQAMTDALEVYLFDHDKQGTEFTSMEYAEAEGLDGADASEAIQYYLDKQRQPVNDALFVLHRVPGTRTTNARWAVGVKAKDVALVASGFYDDALARIRRAVIRDMRAQGKINPRAQRKVDAQLKALGGAMEVLAVAVGEVYEEEEDEGV